MYNRFVNKLRIFYYYIIENIKIIFLKKVIYLGGYSYSKNFGDALSVFLVKFLSDKHVIHNKFIKNKKHPVYYVVGSILQWANENSYVWGSGFIESKANLTSNNITIYAVRGYLTLAKLEKAAVPIGDIAIGDPALLLPLIFNPIVKTKYKVGIIPHYVDKKSIWIKKYQHNNDVKIIDIECGNKWERFVKDVLMCEVILSSSLHGLIIAEAYGIPTTWVEFSNSIRGEKFKFKDYYTSINVKDFTCFSVKPDTGLNELINRATKKKLDINLYNLLNSCPFISKNKKQFMLKRLYEK